MNRRIDFLVGFIFAVAGIGILIGAFVLKQSKDEFMASALSTTGTIESIETYTKRDADGDLRTCHDVYVGYETENGEQYSGIEYGYFVTGMKQGDEVTVFYDPDNPNHIMSSEGSTFGVILMLIMGSAFAAIGVLIIVLHFKNSDKGAVV